MNRVSGQGNTSWRSSKAVESVGVRPTTTVDGNFLVLRWTKEEAAQVMDAAGLPLDRVIAKYLLPAADATKTIYIKHRGQITERREVPDPRAQLRAMKLVMEIQWEWVPRRNGPVNWSDVRELIHMWPTPNQFDRDFFKRMKPALRGPRPTVRSTRSIKQKKIDRAGEQKKRIGPANAVESVGPRPKITIEGNFLVLRWTKEEAAHMTLERVIAEHLIPNLHASKTICSKYRGQIVQRCRLPDGRAQFRALKLVLELHCERVAPKPDARPSKPTSQFIVVSKEMYDLINNRGLQN